MRHFADKDRVYSRLHARGHFDDRVEGLLARGSVCSPETPLVKLECQWTTLLDRR